MIITNAPPFSHADWGPDGDPDLFAVNNREYKDIMPVFSRYADKVRSRDPNVRPGFGSTVHPVRNSYEPTKENMLFHWSDQYSDRPPLGEVVRYVGEGVYVAVR